MELFALVLVTILLLYLTKWWNHARKWLHFPGPPAYKSLPILGHTYMLAGRQLKEVLKENRRKYGDIYRFDVGAIPTVFICDYDDICRAYKSTDVFSGKFLTHEQPGAEAIRFVDSQGEVTGLSSLVSNGYCCTGTIP